MIQTFTIPGRLPGYNELHGHWAASARIKADATEDIGWAAKAAHIAPVGGRVRITVRCYEPNARRDMDNVLSGAAKCVYDALQQIGVLSNDNWKCVVPNLPPPEVDRQNPRVEITIETISPAE